MRHLPLLALLLLPACGVRDSGDKDSQIVLSPTKEEFDRLIENSAVVLVDFSATWCAPCKLVKPTIRELEKDYRGKVKVIEVDGDARPEITANFQVRGYPTFMIFRNGKKDRTIVGVPDRIELVEALENALR